MSAQPMGVWKQLIHAKETQWITLETAPPTKQ